MSHLQLRDVYDDGSAILVVGKSVWYLPTDREGGEIRLIDQATRDSCGAKVKVDGRYYEGAKGIVILSAAEDVRNLVQVILLANRSTEETGEMPLIAINPDGKKAPPISSKALKQRFANYKATADTARL